MSCSSRLLLAAPLLLLACTVPMIGGPPLAAPERPTAPVVEAPAEPTGSATLQDCGNWPRSVLCEVEIRASVDRGPWQRFDPRDHHTLAPAQLFEIEVLARDQFGREFPPDRLALGIDADDCEGLIDVENRGRGLVQLRAIASSGYCDMDLWIPGNLNFDWRLQFEISPQARTGYSRAEAELIVHALYLGILGREPDEASFGAAVAEVQRGNLEAQVESMTRSGEFLQLLSGINPSDLLERLYQGLLRRPVDSGGTSTYLRELQFHRYAEVVLRIVRSPEFEDRLAREAR